MQKINYNEIISLKTPISELILINIDEKLTQTKDSDCIKITGTITISGEANTTLGKENFIHPIEVDITLSKEQLINDEANISVDDFDYNLDNEKIKINLIIKIDGLKEIEPYFPPQEDQENSQIIIESEQRELIEDTIYIDQLIEKQIDDDIVNQKDTSIVEEVSNKKEENQSKSLLSQIFKRKKSITESCYLFHVIKHETTYKEVAQLYNCDEDLLKNLNKDAKLYQGKLLLIPKKS